MALSNQNTPDESMITTLASNMVMQLRKNIDNVRTLEEECALQIAQNDFPDGLEGFYFELFIVKRPRNLISWDSTCYCDYDCVCMYAYQEWSQLRELFLSAELNPLNLREWMTKFMKYHKSFCPRVEYDGKMERSIIYVPPFFFVKHRQFFHRLLSIGSVESLKQFDRNLIDLIRSGDIESNPGPVQSKPFASRNNDPRLAKLERAIERRESKIRTLIAQLRREVKISRAQGLFSDGVKIEGIKDLNKNLDRVCDFMDKSLPGLVSQVTATVGMSVDKTNLMENDLIKVALILVLLKILISWKKYRTAIVCLLLFVLKFYNVDQYIVDLFLKLKSEICSTRSEAQSFKEGLEEVVYCPWFSTVGKIIFGLLACFAIKKIPGKQDWDNFILRMDRIPKAVEGTRKVFDYCSEYFNIATDEIKKLVLGKELKGTQGLYEEIHEWAEEIRHYLDLDERNRISFDIETSAKVEDLYKRGLKYAEEKIPDRDVVRLVSTMLYPAKSLYEQVMHSPIKGGGPKMRPITVWLVGESGIGKTEMVYPLCIDVLRTMGIIKPDAYQHQAYARQTETEYWDGYHGQKIVIYDDAFQLKDDKSKPNPEIFEVIRSCNTFPQHLHMAALTDKNTFSQAEMLLYTTNQFEVDLQSITFQDAFYNRMKDFAYRVEIRSEFAKEAINSRGQTYKTLDKTKLDTNNAVDLRVYQFQKMEFVGLGEGSWRDSGLPLSYEEFSKLVCDAWKQEKQRSVDKLVWLEKYASRSQAQALDDLKFVDAESSVDIEDLIRFKKSQGKSDLEIESEIALDEEAYDAYLYFKESQRSKKVSKWGKVLEISKTLLSKIVDLIVNLKNKTLELVRKHPYLALLSCLGLILGTFSIYQELKHLFSDEESQAEVATSGDEKTLRKSKCVVEVASSGDAKTFKTRKSAIEALTSGDVKTLRKKNSAVESESVLRTKTERLMEEEANAQGCSDSTARSLVLDVLSKNTYRISVEFDGDVEHNFEMSLGNVAFLRGWVFIMPYHFLEGMHARKFIEKNGIVHLSQPLREHVISFPVSHILQNTEDLIMTDNVVRLYRRNGESLDCVAIHIGKQMCHPHRDITAHFVMKEDQGKITGTTCGNLASYHDTRKELVRLYQWVSEIKPNDVVAYDMTIDLDNYSYIQRECYTYNAPTTKGDCGSILAIYNNRMTRKLIGMHIAGREDNKGHSVSLTQDLLLDALSQLESRDPIANATAQCMFEPPKVVDPLKKPVLPEGLFVPVGKSSIKVGQAVKTSLLPSAIYGELSEPITKPAHLRPTILPNGERCNPLMKGLKKCGVETAMLEDEVVRSAAMDISQIVLNRYNQIVNKKHYQRILTYEEAVAGTQDDAFMSGIARQTSPGFGYIQGRKLPGKQDWMGKGEEYDFTSAKARQLRKDVEDLINDCKRGVISNVVFIDTLKDERRPIAKVDAGKTRVFSAGPQHFVVAFRQYFLPFAAWLMHNRIDNEIAVGTNVYSEDWDHIARVLRRKGNKVIAGDFGNFDGSLVAQILWAIFDEVYVPWLKSFNDLTTPEGLELVRTCTCLWAHIAHSVHIFDDNVYMWTHSQPSGNPFTVIINCLYNSIIMRVNWILLARKFCPSQQSMKCFRKHVSMISYGDDNCLNISDEVIEWFNQITISAQMKEIKHEYTDEGKTGEMVKFRTLGEIQFLKRGFRFNKRLQRVVAPLQLDVIYEMLNWTRNTIDPNEILKMNIETAMREIVYHGKEEYVRLKQGIERLADEGKLSERPQILSYEAYLTDASLLSDDLYDF